MSNLLIPNFTTSEFSNRDFSASFNSQGDQSSYTNTFEIKEDYIKLQEINDENEKENKHLKELLQNLQSKEKRYQILLELTKIKDSYKNVSLYIFYSTSTMAIL